MDISKCVKLTFDTKSIVHYHMFGGEERYLRIQKLWAHHIALTEIIENSGHVPHEIEAIAYGNKLIVEELDRATNDISTRSRVELLISTTEELLTEITKRTISCDGLAFYIERISQIELFEVNTRLHASGFKPWLMRTDWLAEKMSTPVTA